jgi:hypothetical protein
LTELDEKSDHLKNIMITAAKDLYHDCPCDGFVFVMYQGDQKKEDRKTRTCSELLTGKNLKIGKMGSSCAGTHTVSYDTDRKCGLLGVYPNRRKVGFAQHNLENGRDLWVAVDSRLDRDFVAISINGKSQIEASRRAARKVFALFV